MVTSIQPHDHFTHPMPDIEGWQESWMLSWYDPRTKCGGYHHVDFQPQQDRVCVQSWYAENGEVISRYQSLNIPTDDYDVSNFSFGPLTVKAPEPFGPTSVSICHIDPETGQESPMVELEVTGFTEPILLAKTKKDVGPSEYTSDHTGHYEIMSHFKGTSTTSPADSRSVRIAAVG